MQMIATYLNYCRGGRVRNPEILSSVPRRKEAGLLLFGLSLHMSWEENKTA